MVGYTSVECVEERVSSKSCHRFSWWRIFTRPETYYRFIVGVDLSSLCIGLVQCHGLCLCMLSFPQGHSQEIGWWECLSHHHSLLVFVYLPIPPQILWTSRLAGRKSKNPTDDVLEYLSLATVRRTSNASHSRQEKHGIVLEECTCLLPVTFLSPSCHLPVTFLSPSYHLPVTFLFHYFCSGAENTSPHNTHLHILSFPSFRQSRKRYAHKFLIGCQRSPYSTNLADDDVMFRPCCPPPPSTCDATTMFAPPLGLPPPTA